MSAKIRILLADDHAVLRSGLEALLSLEDDMLVVGHASTGEEAGKDPPAAPRRGGDGPGHAGDGRC